MYTEKIKTIDLSAFVEKTLEIIMCDGRTLHLLRPTKAIVLMLQALQEAEVTDKIDDFICAAMSHNSEGVEIKKEEISEMPDIMKSAIMGAYLDFIHELVHSPNSQSPACPGKEEKARKSPRK